MKMYLFALISVLLLSVTTAAVQVSPLSAPEVRTFKAASYDYQPSFPANVTGYTRSMSLTYMSSVLEDFKNVIMAASLNGCSIIVFPEYGLSPGFFIERERFFNFSESLHRLDETPCTTEDVEFEVQTKLSCLANKYNIYIVVNMGIRQKCHTSNKMCLYNTNLIFSNNGVLKAAYFKENLFMFETITFDTPTHDQLPVYLDTHFGRIATFTCFDILFRSPSIELLELHNIDHVFFPTAWVNVYPYFSAVQFHSSFATAHSINFISSNLHMPKYNVSGSGIYGPGKLVVYRDDSSSGSLLLQAELQKVPAKIPQLDSVSADVSADNIRSLPVIPNPSHFTIFGDVYNIVPLIDIGGSLKVCKGEICCELEYAFKNDNLIGSDKFYLGVFDGLHTLEGQYYMQICTLINCGEGGTASCDLSRWSVSSKPLKRFTRIQMRGHFPQRNVQPQVYTGLYATQQTIDWDGDTLRYGDLDSGVVLRSATLFSRVYSKDGGK